MSGRRPWLVTLGTLALDVVLLFGAVAMGLRIADTRTVGGLPDGWPLDYASRLGTLVGLDPGFVSQILGGGRPGSTGGVEAGPLAPPVAPPRPTQPGDDPHTPTNDNFKDARSVGTLPYRATTTTNESTRETEEPSGCVPALGGTLWYRFTPEESVGVIADTIGSDHATVLAVYTGSSLTSLTALGCDADVRGASLVPFPAVPGETYFFQVGAPTNEVNPLLGKGSLVFRLTPQGTTSLASMGDNGQADGDSHTASLSADGRYVTFISSASNLDPRHARVCPSVLFECAQVYVRDLRDGRTSMVSISSRGEPGNGQAWSGLGGEPRISADGQFVVFVSKASNLVEDDRNVCTAPVNAVLYVSPLPGTCSDVFVHDRDADGNHAFDEDPMEKPGAVSTTRVSVSSSGEEADGQSGGSLSISANGRWVTFGSQASNLVEGPDPMCQNHEPPYDEWNCTDVFLRDLRTGKTTLVSAAPDSQPGDAGAGGAFISADGRYVAFSSASSNLVRGERRMCAGRETQGKANCSEVFVHDRTTGRVVKVSVASDGAPLDRENSGASISADGRFVAFTSWHRFRYSDGRTNRNDVFVRDRDADRDGVFDERGAVRTFVASVSSDEQPGDLSSGHASISANGRFVAFTSPSTNLVPDDSNRAAGYGEASGYRGDGFDVFVRDLRWGQTIRISVSSEGREAPGGATTNAISPAVSADGRVFVWDTDSGDLVSDDRHPGWDVFVHRLRWR